MFYFAMSHIEIRFVIKKMWN